MRSLEGVADVDELQVLMYPLDQVPKIEWEPFDDVEVTPEECLEIAGLFFEDGRMMPYSHVVRKVANVAGSVNRDSNEPFRGTDKMVFYIRDIHGKFHWSAVYSSALFIGDNIKIMTT